MSWFPNECFCPADNSCLIEIRLIGEKSYYLHCEHCLCLLCQLKRLSLDAERQEDSLVERLETEQRSPSRSSEERQYHDAPMEEADLHEGQFQSPDSEEEDVQSELLESPEIMDRPLQTSTYDPTLSNPAKDVYTWIPKVGTVICTIPKRIEVFQSTESNPEAKGLECPNVSLSMYASPLPSKYSY